MSDFVRDVLSTAAAVVLGQCLIDGYAQYLERVIADAEAVLRETEHVARPQVHAGSIQVFAESSRAHRP